MYVGTMQRNWLRMEHRDARISKVWEKMAQQYKTNSLNLCLDSNVHITDGLTPHPEGWPKPNVSRESKIFRLKISVWFPFQCNNGVPLFSSICLPKMIELCRRTLLKCERQWKMKWGLLIMAWNSSNELSMTLKVTGKWVPTQQKNSFDISTSCNYRSSWIITWTEATMYQFCIKTWPPDWI